MIFTGYGEVYAIGVVICSNEEQKMQHHNALCHPLRLSDRHRIKKREGGGGNNFWTFLGDNFNFFAISRSSLKTQL